MFTRTATAAAAGVTHDRCCFPAQEHCGGGDGPGTTWPRVRGPRVTTSDQAEAVCPAAALAQGHSGIDRRCAAILLRSDAACTACSPCLRIHSQMLARHTQARGGCRYRTLAPCHRAERFRGASSGGSVPFAAHRPILFLTLRDLAAVDTAFFLGGGGRMLVRSVLTRRPQMPRTTETATATTPRRQKQSQRMMTGRLPKRLATRWTLRERARQPQ